MTISVTKVGGWATNEKLTSAQQTALDVNVTNAVDKRSGALEIDSQDVSIWVPLVPIGAVPSGWAMDFATPGTSNYWREANTAGTIGPFVFPIGVRAKGTLKSLQIYMQGTGNGGVHAAFPATLPIWKLFTQTTTNYAVQTSLQSVTAVANANFGDGPTNFANTIANYNDAWSVTLSNGGAGFGDRSHSQSYNIYLWVYGEAGANSVNDSLVLTGIKATWTCTGLYPGS